MTWAILALLVLNLALTGYLMYLLMIFHSALVDTIHQLRSVEDDLEAVYEVVDPEQFERKAESQVFVVQQEKAITH